MGRSMFADAMNSLKKKKASPIVSVPKSAPSQSFAPAPTAGSLRQGQTPQQWNSGGGGYGGSQQFNNSFSLPATMNEPAPAAPAPAPAAPVETYSMTDSNERIASVDSTFRDQQSSYNENLAKFVADIARREKTLKYDTDKAEQGVARNKEIGMTGIGEDFAARGLGHSGMFADAAQKGTQAYERQNTSLLDAEATGLGDLSFSRNKETSDNTARIQAAKRDALYRLQLKNNLVTGL